MESKSLEILAELHDVENDPNIVKVKTTFNVSNLNEEEIISLYGLITKSFMKAIQDGRVKNNESDEDCSIGLIFIELLQSNEKMLNEFYPDILEHKDFMDFDEIELFNCDDENVIN